MRSAQVKEEPAQRAGDTEQSALPPCLPVRSKIRFCYPSSTAQQPWHLSRQFVLLSMWLAL